MLQVSPLPNPPMLTPLENCQHHHYHQHHRHHHHRKVIDIQWELTDWVPVTLTHCCRLRPCTARLTDHYTMPFSSHFIRYNAQLLLVNTELLPTNYKPAMHGGVPYMLKATCWVGEHQIGQDFSSFKHVMVVGSRTDDLRGFLLTTIKLAAKLYIHSQFKKNTKTVRFISSVIIFFNASLQTGFWLHTLYFTDQVFGNWNRQHKEIDWNRAHTGCWCLKA